MQQENGAVSPRVKVQLTSGGTAFFGPGPARLLREIAACGSVHGACERMQLSYSKGRRLIRTMEAAMGAAVVECVQGGPGGGSAALTPAGRELVERWEELERRVRDCAAREFASCFPEWKKEKDT